MRLKLIRRAEVRLRGPERGSSKVIDAGLTSSNMHDQFPLIAVEVGFTQTLEDLFDCAERLFRGTYNQIQFVIIVKIFETNRHCGDQFPWGINPHDLNTLRNMDKARALAPAIESWYDTNGLPIIGDLEVKVFWYPCDRKTRPTIPLYSFKHDPQRAFTLGAFSPN